MADASHVKNGRLGPFQLDRRYRLKDKDRDDLLGTDLGRVYEAHNVHTGVPALVVIPGQRVGWEPNESWQLRASSHAEPPYLALEVEHAPSSGRLTILADLLDLLTCAVERMEPSEESRAHLTGGPMPLLKRWAGRWRRLPRSRRRGLAAAAFAMLCLGLGLTFWMNLPGGPRGPQDEQFAAPGVAVAATASADAPTLAQTNNRLPSVITYPLPTKPFRNQAKAPCLPKKGELEINGGCWVELAKRPPCYDDQAEYQGKCYLPVAAREPEPRAVQP